MGDKLQAEILKKLNAFGMYSGIRHETRIPETYSFGPFY